MDSRISFTLVKVFSFSSGNQAGGERGGLTGEKLTLRGLCQSRMQDSKV